MTPVPVVPNYEGRCITQVLGALGPTRRTSPLTDLTSSLAGADGVVLVILDGLGAEQLEERGAIAPWMSQRTLEPLLSVAPSTTAAALSSLTTGVAPGRHGMVGYRFAHQGEVLQSLRWTVDGNDARGRHAPDQVQPIEPKLAGVPYVGKKDFATSAFTAAHLRGCAYRPIDSLEAMRHAIVEASLEAPFVVAYHDAIDKVSHAYGFGPTFDAAIYEADQFLEALRDDLGSTIAIVVTADHGQVDIGSASVDISAATDALVAFRSGEGRFRWLHAVPGEAADLARRTAEELGESCWVWTKRQVLADGLLGEVDDTVAERLGDVCVVPFAPVFVPDPLVPKEAAMRGRHGSLTSAEMLVPLLLG